MRLQASGRQQLGASPRHLPAARRATTPGHVHGAPALGPKPTHTHVGPRMCGGGGGQEAQTDPPPTRSEWLWGGAGMLEMECLEVT